MPDQVDVEIHRRATDVPCQGCHDHAALHRNLGFEAAFAQRLEHDVLRKLLLDVGFGITERQQLGNRFDKRLHQNISFRIASATDSRYGKLTR